MHSSFHKTGSTDRKDKIIEPEVKKYPVQDMFAALVSQTIASFSKQCSQ